MAETVPETLTKEKQKLTINKSSCEQDNCESVVVVYNQTDIRQLIIVNV